ncbi:gb [Venturia nashicola]|nr:gb [Venturia nashicola]
MPSTPLIQPPPMAYSPPMANRGPHGQGLAQAYYSQSNYHKGQSPFSSTHSFAPTSPHPTNGSSSLESPVLGKTVSESSDSIVSSPARSSYGALATQALRHSTISHQESNSHLSVGNAPFKDLEKKQMRDSRHTPSSRPRSYGYTTSAGGPRDDLSGALIESKAAKILLYLSTLNPFVSLVILLYTIFALITLLLLQPLRLCTQSTTFRLQIIGFLAPTLRIQLAFIYSPDIAETFSAPLLVMINLFSPLISLGVATAAWVAAAFWFFNAILGDPDGSDKPRGYNDGRATVIQVRKWWERWLTRALR